MNNVRDWRGAEKLLEQILRSTFLHGNFRAKIPERKWSPAKPDGFSSPRRNAETGTPKVMSPFPITNYQLPIAFIFYSSFKILFISTAMSLQTGSAETLPVHKLISLSIAMFSHLTVVFE